MENSNDQDTASQLNMKVCKAAQRGNCEKIMDLLTDLSPDLISKALCLTSELHLDQTPLIIAARYGHINVVRLLLNDFSPYYEEKLSIVDRGQRWLALRAAMWSDKMEIVKLFLDTETDTELLYKGDSSALHLACRDNRLASVQYLVESKGAKTNFFYYPGRTCLQFACLARNTEMVRLLLKHGADPNLRSRDDQTALHYAVYHHLPEMATVLMEYGAQMLPNRRRQTPLVESVVHESHECFHLILASNALTRQDKINGLELQAAMVAPANPASAYQLLWRAMEERNADPSNILTKPQRPPVPALGDVVESRNHEELVSRQRDFAALQMECLIIPQRILGLENKCTWDIFLTFCKWAAYEGRYMEALSVWIYAKQTCQTKYIEVDFYDVITRVLNEILRANSTFPFETIEQILVLSVDDMERKVKEEWVDTMSAYMQEYNITQCLVFLTHALRMASEEEMMRLTSVVRRLFRVQHSTHVSPVLHLAVSLYQSYNLMAELRPSLPRLVAFLLQCGAKVDEVDSFGQTPLHAISRSSSYPDDTQALCGIVQALLDGEAHADLQDPTGQTPLEVAATDEVRCVLKGCYPLSLKCIAISAVLRNRIPHSDGLPKEVMEDIEQHKPTMIQGI